MRLPRPAGAPPPGEAAGPASRFAGRGGGLANLQALRALAAGAVVVCHAVSITDTVRGGPELSGAVDYQLGIWGVAVFFALSGYLMAGLVRDGRPWRFLLHRIARIFAGFLGILALAALALWAAGLATSFNLLALTLAPAGPRTYPLNVEWTLVFETSFYVALFALALAGRVAWLDGIALGWLAILAAAWAVLPPPYRGLTTPTLYLLPLSAACVPFAGGLLLPRLLAARRRPPALGLLAPLLLAPVLFGLSLPLEMDSARWLAGLGAVGLVGAAVRLPQLDRRRPAGRALVAFGDWSYALYLLHVPAILIAASTLPAGWPKPAVAVAAGVAALAAAALVGPTEVATYRALRTRIEAARPRRLVLVGAAYLAVFAVAALLGSAETARDDWQRARAERALSGLPDAALRDPEAFAAAVRERGLGLPPTVLAAVDGLVPVPGNALVLSGWATDLARPAAVLHLAALCRGRPVVAERPRRLRPDLRGRPELAAARERRIGFRVPLPKGACRAGEPLLAVLVDPDGRLGLLAAPSVPYATAEPR